MADMADMADAITLTRGVQTLLLPADLIWADELAWSPVVQKTDYSIEGALVIDRFVRQAGRPITLQGHASRAWVERGVLRQLQHWAGDEAEPVMTLTLRGVARRVIFDLGGEGRAIEGQPVIAWAAPQDGDDYGGVTLRFIEV